MNEDSLKSCKDTEEFRIIMSAISCATLANTEKSFKATEIEKDNPHWTPAYEDVREAIKREMLLMRKLSVAKKELKGIRSYLDSCGYEKELGTDHSCPESAILFSIEKTMEEIEK